MSSSLERAGHSPRWGAAISAQCGDYQALQLLNNDATRARSAAVARCAEEVEARQPAEQARNSTNDRGDLSFFFHTHLLSNFWTSHGHRCRPFSPPVLAFNFYRAQGSAIPLLVDFSSSVADSRSRAFRKSICAQEKVPANLYEYALGGIRTHETDLYQARG